MNREEQIKNADDLLSEGKFEEARSLVDAIKKHDAEELENKASEEQPEEDKIVEEKKDENNSKINSIINRYVSPASTLNIHSSD